MILDIRIFEINFDNIFSKLFRILIVFLNVSLKHFTLKKSVIHKIITKAHNKLIKIAMQ